MKDERPRGPGSFRAARAGPRDAGAGCAAGRDHQGDRRAGRPLDAADAGGDTRLVAGLTDGLDQRHLLA
ncbi:hypothetical protein [Methylobacterium soli]|uniref:Uncharacterized protein n=1 Tax=Methylobacterium soli TaxID=553447 RepID=A0A6L3T2B6_9HYPH|nr:hypothetical protein [Methylobacterium soli]KAB1080172.1 hypothetical protein F6X53_08115 [Methylobacterium soli]